MTKIDAQILEKASAWLTPVFDTDTQAKVQKLIDTNPKELTESFYTDLAFGTGGMRGGGDAAFRLSPTGAPPSERARSLAPWGGDPGRRAGPRSR